MITHIFLIHLAADACFHLLFYNHLKPIFLKNGILCKRVKYSTIKTTLNAWPHSLAWVTYRCSCRWLFTAWGIPWTERKKKTTCEQLRTASLIDPFSGVWLLCQLQTNLLCKPRRWEDQNEADPWSSWYPSPKVGRTSVRRLMTSISTQY